MRSTSNRLLLAIAAKAPIPGLVKTRFCPDLTTEEATALYRCFLEDIRAEMGSLTGIDRALYYTPADAADYFTAFKKKGFQLFPQTGTGLGERQNNIFMQQSAEGYDAITLIGSDSPDLPRSIVKSSFALLASGQADAVFGPSSDGGYYLVGLRRPQPQLFRNIPWGTNDVLEKTLKAAEKSGLKTKLLEMREDLDTFDNLSAYFRRHKCQPSDNRRVGQQTFAFLSGLANRTGCFSHKRSQGTSAYRS